MTYPQISRKGRAGQSGVTLIELMVAMVLGVLVAAGIVTVFLSTSSSNLAQNQVARLQEEGRYAVSRLKDDLSMANGQYCTNSGGTAAATSSGLYLDGLRAPTVYVTNGTNFLNALSDLTTPWGDGTSYPAAPTAPYSLPSFLSMRGYDCTISACTPIDPNSQVAGIPKPGTALGDRVVGTSVLTLRYVNEERGWTVMPAGSAKGAIITANGDGTLKQIDLNPMPGERPASDFGAGHFALLASCSGGQIFAVDGGGGSTLSPNGSNMSLPSAQAGGPGLKLFDFNTDYQTVTYYLKVVDNGDGRGHTTGALIRRVNGEDRELVRGVERLDFDYGVERADGSIQFLSAAAVDAGINTDCPPSVPISAGPSDDKGCLWRSIKSIEVHLLMDGQVPLYSLTADEMAYAYSGDGIATPKAPSDSGRAVKPSQQGFVDQMIRREFTALVSVRNFNP